jgi:hypothetical protein
MSHTESKVQIAPESTGPKVRTLKVETVLGDGTTALVDIQVVSIADEFGRLMELMDPEWKEEVLTELRAIRATLWEILGRPALPGESLRAATKGGNRPWT